MSEEKKKEPKVLRNKVITKSKKTGNIEAEPDFGRDEVVFYRIPHKFWDMVKVDECWEGEITEVKDTGNKDKRGVPILISVFIPVKKINGVH